jgi:hypothetical protein
MARYTVADLMPRLISEMGYPPYAADGAARSLVDADPRIQEAFYRWWTTGEVTEMEVCGYTLERLARDYKLNPVAGFLTLNWLLKEPEAALALLARGFDTVS